MIKINIITRSAISQGSIYEKEYYINLQNIFNDCYVSWKLYNSGSQEMFDNYFNLHPISDEFIKVINDQN